MRTGKCGGHRWSPMTRTDSTKVLNEAETTKKSNVLPFVVVASVVVPSAEEQQHPAEASRCSLSDFSNCSSTSVQEEAYLANRRNPPEQMMTWS